jgi:hypothetical protein
MPQAWITYVAQPRRRLPSRSVSASRKATSLESDRGSHGGSDGAAPKWARLYRARGRSAGSPPASWSNRCRTSASALSRPPKLPLFAKSAARRPPGRTDAQSGRGARRCSGSLRSVWVELLGEKHGRRLEDLVRAAQLVVLLAQPPDLLTLLAGHQIGALAREDGSSSIRGLRETQPGSRPRSAPPWRHQTKSFAAIVARHNAAVNPSVRLGGRRARRARGGAIPDSGRERA